MIKTKCSIYYSYCCCNTTK